MALTFHGVATFSSLIQMYFAASLDVNLRKNRRFHVVLRRIETFINGVIYGNS